MGDPMPCAHPPDGLINLTKNELRAQPPHQPSPEIAHRNRQTAQRAPKLTGSIPAEAFGEYPRMSLLEPDVDCLIEPLIEAISGKWKLLIIFWLAKETSRFNQLQRNLGKITHRTLTRQLSELQDAGFVARKDFQTIPPHVEYSLTPLGQSLIPLLREMHDWAAKNTDKLSGPKKPEAK